MAQLRAGSHTRSAIVVGKVHLYRDRSGVGYVSVRAEGIRTVSEVDERGALADIVRQSLDRLDLLERIEKGPPLEDGAARADGVPLTWVRAARESLRRYPQADRAAFRRELRTAVRRVGGDTAPEPSPTGPPPTVTVVRAPPTRPPPPPPTAAEREEEAVFLDLVDEVAEVSADGYADLKELLARVGARGLVPDRAEATLNRLEEEGVIEEPIVGKLRRA